VFQAFRTLNGVELRSVQADPCHAGEALQVTLAFGADARARRSLRARLGSQETWFDLTMADDGRVRITVPTQQRGWCRTGRILLYCEYPFGLFRVWSWLNPDFAALVYPRPEEQATPLPHAPQSAEHTPIRRTGDEFAMLRAYHPSDPRRSIAWKASARHDKLLVKEFEQRRGDEIVLDWDATARIPYEARISRLTRWVIDAEGAQHWYVMRLPDQSIGPGQGPDHCHACLCALALMPGALE